jgi:hypothetical protein
LSLKKEDAIKSLKNWLADLFSLDGNNPFLLIKVPIILNVLIVNFSYTNLVKKHV